MVDLLAVWGYETRIMIAADFGSSKHSIYDETT